ncbi:MAG: 5'-nucleotidase C-terminal domain-containing protein [Clostridia bacterium]|nr:5'-nucleotidase C-terminal domain-containing protein [Clostridia bacterium]
MNKMKKMLSLAVALCMFCGIAASASASTFTDAHGNVIELDEALEAYTNVTLAGADDAARKGETNLGDLWTDALRWFAVSGAINEYWEEDDVTAGNTAIAVDADRVVALWNGGNLRADVAEGKFGAEQLAEVLPYPNKVAVVYMTGAQLAEALEAASQGLPYSEESADACASFMQVSGLKYTVDTKVAYDRGEAYGDKGIWFKAASLGRVHVEEVNGQPFDSEAVYAVITSNANFNGMDSSYIFPAAAEANEKSTITTAVVRDVIWLYIAAELNNIIGDSYAQAQGRVTVQ